MKRWMGMLITMGALLTGATAQAQPGIEVMTGAMLIGQSDVNDVRAFPEMAVTAEGRAAATSRLGLAVHARDAVYESPLSYADTVRYFDEQLARRRLRVVARTVTEAATAWAVQRSDATVANIIVRTTTPKTTFEIAQVASD